MKYPNRKNQRLQNYNYNQSGCYFLTICSKEKQKIFGEIVGGGAFDAPKTNLSKAGKTAEKYILSSNNIPEIEIKKYVIMPNHIHMLISLKNSGASKAPLPTNNKISLCVSTLKRFINKEIGENIFQRSFYDHVIRNEEEYKEIWKYIDENPQKWSLDEFYKI